MFSEAAQWVAPIATMIAAVMTAANLGPRVTGWGFAVFAAGAVAWVAVGVATGQRSLIVANGFLLIVDMVGVWRWLGRRARYEAGARSATERSDAGDTASLFALSRIEGRPVIGPDGATLGTAVDAMAGCGDGRVRYLVVSQGGVGGVGERLHALGWDEVRIGEARIAAEVSADAFARRPALDPARWPASAEAAVAG